MAMSPTERATIQNVAKKLSKGTTQLDPKLVPHLEALRLWLDTWVIPPLEMIAKEDRTTEELRLARDLSR
jgi:hypothetical protein